MLAEAEGGFVAFYPGLSLSLSLSRSLSVRSSVVAVFLIPGLGTRARTLLCLSPPAPPVSRLCH